MKMNKTDIQDYKNESKKSYNLSEEDKRWWEKGRDLLLDLMCPRHCPICDGIVKIHSGYICEKCIGKAIYLKEPTCLICGKELKEDREEYCEDCKKHRHYFIQNFGCFEYASVAESIYRYKYKGRQEYADYYAQEIVEQLGEVIMTIKPDALIPVPIHKSKMRTRGFNQAELIEKAIGKQMYIPVLTNYVVRVRKTTPQKELSRIERQNNLKRAFKIAQNDVKLNTIIVIDDIYTTGSTIDMVSQTCMDSGVKRVYGICLAIGRGI